MVEKRCGFVTFLVLLLISKTRCDEASDLRIPGCIDLESLPNNLAELESDQIAKLKCLCSPSKQLDLRDEMGVSIMCIYGSKLSDLKQAMGSVIKANRTIHRITINHMTIDGTTDMTTSYIDSLNELQQFEIRSCHGSMLNVSDILPLHRPLDSIVELTIEDCQLEWMPSDLLKQTPSLRLLNVRKNKIITIQIADFEAMTESLEILDMSGNLLGEVEPGAIEQLKELKKLAIGEHNSIKNLARELGKLRELRILDLTRTDGLDDLSKIDFSKMNNLQSLILTGCNLKMINKSHLAGLENLRKLDLRVNLLESIEGGSFEELKNLNYLSLAGNFLNESNFGPKLWKGLENLQFLDIGWNEITEISRHFFEGAENTLKALDLSHNEKLIEVEEGSFNMTQLERLNMNGCGMRNITFGMFTGLERLKELDLSFNKIQIIEPDAFDAQQGQVRQLALDGNQLKQLDMDMLKKLSNLTEIDLSDNPWVCDKNAKFLANWVKYRYQSAAENNQEFLLKNSEKTVCNRPYRVQNRPILDLGEDEFEENFDEKLDTTTIEAPTTTTKEEESQGSTLNFENIFFVVGNSTNDTLAKEEDLGKPRYDINSIKYGVDNQNKKSHDWVSLITVSVLVIATLVGVILVVRRRKQNAKEAAMNESFSVNKI